MRRLPLQDSPAHAARCRDLLDLDRGRAQRLGQDTAALLRAGAYVDPGGRTVSLADAIRAHRAAKESLAPDAPLDPAAAVAARRFGETTTAVHNEPTLTAARSFAARGGKPCVLNFANGTDPGGGFLTGSRAQEETLCFASTLFSALDGDPMYAAHQQGDPLRCSSWVLRCDATVFRDERHQTIAAPWTMTVLTCAAPTCNRNHARGRTPVPVAEGAALLRARVDRVLDLAAARGETHLVLGAWGCGAFHNDPERVADHFLAALDRLDGVFAEVVFAISDWSPERRFLGPFARRFAA